MSIGTKAHTALLTHPEPVCLSVPLLATDDNMVDLGMHPREACLRTHAGCIVWL